MYSLVRLDCPHTRPELLREFPTLATSSRIQDECLAVLDRFDRFGREIAPLVPQLDEVEADGQGGVLDQVLECACRHRLFSLAIPQSFGGSGVSMLALSMGLEHLSATCVGIANVVAAHGLALAMIGAAGQVRLLRTLAQRIVEGETQRRPFLLATAATEPSAGSDLEDFDAMGRAFIESHADPSGDDFVLHGRKIYVSNGSIASAYVVVMPTDRKRARETLSAFLVYAGVVDVSVVRTEGKLGQRACPAAEVRFDGCRVPKELRLNEETIAGRTLDLVLGASRATVGAFGAGVARGVFATCRDLARRIRGADGSRWIDHPRIRAALARLWSNATLARCAYLNASFVQHRVGLVSLLESEPLRALDRVVPNRLTRSTWADKVLGSDRIDREARRLLDGIDESRIALASAHGSSAKVQTSELALANCLLALEEFGTEATREDSGLPKYWRDARLLSIYEGTNEICTLDVANKLLDPTREARQQ